MENGVEKMHSMISSTHLAAAKQDALKSYEAAVVKYNFSAIRSIRDAFNNECPSIGSLKAKMIKVGKASLVKDVLEMMVAKTVRAFNLPREKQIEITQIHDLVDDIQVEHYYLKLSEVYFILRQARLGRQGKIYERMDGPTIMSWFDDYAEMRFQMAIDKTLSDHDRQTADEKSRAYDGFIVDLHSKQTSIRNKQVKNIAYAMAQQMTNKAMEKFNKQRFTYLPNTNGSNGITPHEEL